MSTIEFCFINKETVEKKRSLICAFHNDRWMDGLYASDRKFQQREVYSWSGKINKVYLCFSPTFKKEKRKNLGCAVVFLEILQNADIIKIRKKVIMSNNDGVSTNIATKLETDLVPCASHKWLYLFGDELNHVRLKSFVDTINDSLDYFVDDYNMRSVLSNLLKQIVIGVGNLHGDRFSILSSIYSLFYGSFLRVLQTAMGWKRVQYK